MPMPSAEYVKTESIPNPISKQIPGKLSNRRISTTIILSAGATAALSLYAFFYALPGVGLYRIDAITLLTTFTSDDFAWLAPIQYVVLSVVVFPFLFVRLFYDELPGRDPIRKGICWSIILWLARGLIVMPIMNEGLFSLERPFGLQLMAITLIGHVIYGLILGSVINAYLIARFHYSRTNVS